MQVSPLNYQYQQKQTATTAPYAQPTQSGNNGANINIGNTGAAQGNGIPINGANGVVINIYNPSVNPNGANFNNTYNTTGTPGQSYDKSYYLPQQNPAPTVPVGAAKLSSPQETDKDKPKKDIVLLTDEYIKTLENYIRNDNPEIKLMGAKELMKRFREDESRKNDVALTNLLNLTLQSKYSPVKMVGMGILENGWAQGDALTQQLLAQIQQSNTSYGLDALDAASAALKSAGQTVKVVDNNPPKQKTESKK